MSDRKAFNFYLSHWEQIKKLDDKQKLQLFNSICEVQFLEKHIDDISFIDTLTDIVWTGIKHSLNTSLSGFINKRKSLNKGVNLPLAKGSSEPHKEPPIQQYKGEVQKEEKEKEKGQLVTGFKKPTIEEIQFRIREMNYHIDAEIFYNYYESNGWKVGRNKMKSWKAALSNWSKKENKQQPQSFKQRDAQKTDDALEAFLDARDKGFDLRKVENNSDYQDVEVIES